MRPHAESAVTTTPILQGLDGMRGGTSRGPEAVALAWPFPKSTYVNVY